jgi:predicted AAA+ superfamily ATPase
MKRSYEKLLRSYLGTFPCVALIGVRQCGKTSLLDVLPEGWKRFDLERRADLQLVSRDPDMFFRLNPRQVAIDEVQVLPDLFPALRVAIDENLRELGRFVITSSSSLLSCGRFPRAWPDESVLSKWLPFPEKKSPKLLATTAFSSAYRIATAARRISSRG